MKNIYNKIHSFFNEIKTAKENYIQESKLIISEERINYIKIRLIISEKLFIEISYNSENERKNFAVIFEGSRVFGYDNLKNWHYHPFQEIEKYILCNKPTTNKIFKELKKIIGKIKLIKGKINFSDNSEG